jgi:heme exporter protein A
LRFGPRWVLARVSFTLPEGGSLLLLGHNGSGKTTLLRVLATALAPDLGTATLDGRPLWADRAELRGQIALLSHATRLYDDLSARENLRAWAQMGGLRPDLDALLRRVGLDHTGDRPARAFSAGMKRRLALGLMLLKRPRLALFDEPFTSLDAEGRELMSEVIDAARADGAITVLCTHHPQIGARHCDRAMRLEQGQIVWTGPAHAAAAVEDE